MAYPSPPRIDWAPDGERILVCAAGRIVVHRSDAPPYALPLTDTLDARWRDDGSIVVIDASGARIRVGSDGSELARIATDYEITAAMHARYGDRWIAVAGAPPMPARMSVTYAGYRNRMEELPRGSDHVIVFDGGTRLWTFDPWIGGIQAEADRWSIAIAPDGSHVTVGYETRAWDDGRRRVESGRGWLVLDTGGWQIVDRAWHPTVRDYGPTLFAFDRAATRFAAVSPESVSEIGAIRVGSGADRYDRAHLGGALAVALDERGLLAAYAYPAGIGSRALCVDYLARHKRGRPVVEIDDTMWIDPELPDVVAIAFDPTGRRIACLASSGAVDVVPVP